MRPVSYCIVHTERLIVFQQYRISVTTNYIHVSNTRRISRVTIGTADDSKYTLYALRESFGLVHDATRRALAA